MADALCLLNIAFLNYQGLCIPYHLIIGMIILLIGILISVYVPFVKKLGATITISGLVIAFAPFILKELWELVWFQILVIGGAMFIIILMILFAGKEDIVKK